MKKEQIEPQGNRLLIERVDADETTEHGIFVAGDEKKSNEGIVIAVGPGEVVEGERTKIDNLGRESISRIMMSVKVGDRVLFPQFSGVEIIADDGKVLMLRSTDIMAIINE